MFFVSFLLVLAFKRDLAECALGHRHTFRAALHGFAAAITCVEYVVRMSFIGESPQGTTWTKDYTHLANVVFPFDTGTACTWAVSARVNKHVIESCLKNMDIEDMGRGQAGKAMETSSKRVKRRALGMTLYSAQVKVPVEFLRLQFNAARVSGRILQALVNCDMLFYPPEAMAGHSITSHIVFIELDSIWRTAQVVPWDV